MASEKDALRLAEKLDELLDLEKTCDLKQFYDGKKWLALLCAAERMRKTCDDPDAVMVSADLIVQTVSTSQKAAKAYDRAKARILGGNRGK